MEGHQSPLSGPKPLFVFVVGDGMADVPNTALGGKTPLMSARCPRMDVLAGQSGVRMARTIPEGLPAGTETAMPLIAGYGTDVLTGRGPMEAAGMGVVLPAGQFAMRVNIVRMDTDDILLEACPELSDDEGFEAARLLAEDAMVRGILGDKGWVLHPQPGFRQLMTGPGETAPTGMTPPHQVSGSPMSMFIPDDATVAGFMRRGRDLLLKRGQGVWPWGAGVVPRYEPFSDKYGVSGAVISAVPVVRGLARLAGMSTPDVPGATGTLHTNWKGKADAVLSAAAAGFGFIMLHAEAPDDCSHARDLKGKIMAIEMLDETIGRVVDGLNASATEYRMALISDHVTDTLTGCHGTQPVPWCVFDSRMPAGEPAQFAEAYRAKAEHYSAPLRELLTSRPEGLA